MPLHQEIRKWLESLIRQRNQLIKRGLSKKNAYQMAETITFLSRRLDYFTFNTDLKISRFFQQNLDNIFFLLPGEGSGSHEKRLEEFNRYSQLTKNIFNGQNLSDRPNMATQRKLQANFREVRHMGIQA